jgi:hypothetical protein
MRDFDSEPDEDSLSRENLGEAPGGAPTANATPIKRGRGRPKGTPKTGGRVKGSPKSYSAPEVRQALLQRSNAIEVLADICAGKKLYVAAPTLGNKPDWTYPTMKERLHALELVLKKVVPDLQASEISGPNGADLYPKQQPLDIRSIAVALVDIGREQKLRAAGNAPRPTIDAKQFEPAPSEIEPTAMTEPLRVDQWTPGEIIEEPTDTPAPEPEPKYEPPYQLGETEVFDNGAWIRLEEDYPNSRQHERRWAVYDFLDTRHASRRNRADAVAKAKALPGGAPVSAVTAARKGGA